MSARQVKVLRRLVADLARELGSTAICTCKRRNRGRSHSMSCNVTRSLKLLKRVEQQEIPIEGRRTCDKDAALIWRREAGCWVLRSTATLPDRLPPVDLWGWWRADPKEET